MVLCMVRALPIGCFSQAELLGRWKLVAFCLSLLRSNSTAVSQQSQSGPERARRELITGQHDRAPSPLAAWRWRRHAEAKEGASGRLTEYFIKSHRWCLARSLCALAHSPVRTTAPSVA